MRILTSRLKVTGKRNKQRLIPFGDELRLSLLNYIKVRNEAVPDREKAFFVKQDGKRLYPMKVYNLVKRNLSKVVTLKKQRKSIRIQLLKNLKKCMNKLIQERKKRR